LALAEVEVVAAEDSEAVYGLAYLGGGGGILVEAAGEDVLKVVALGAEAVGTGVRGV
jgi:hypothetical protein